MCEGEEGSVGEEDSVVKLWKTSAEENLLFTVMVIEQHSM